MLDFERICTDHKIPFIRQGHHHCHDGWLQTHCPFCSAGKDGWHLGFNLERGNFNCWRCGSLNAVAVLSVLLHVSNSEASQLIHTRQKAGGHAVPIAERKEEIEPPPGIMPLGILHKHYLKKRGFDPDELEATWGLKGTQHLGGIWSWRIIIPVHDGLGRIVAYQGRALDHNVKPKYRMSDDKDILCDPRGLLYGEHLAKHAVVIVEGAADVWRIGPGAVATFGINWKPQQAHKLRKYRRRYVMFDPEPKAQQRARDLARWLALYPGETEIVDDLRTDPGDMGWGMARRVRALLEETTHD